jgi:hypothetical protein
MMINEDIISILQLYNFLHNSFPLIKYIINLLPLANTTYLMKFIYVLYFIRDDENNIISLYVYIYT